MTTPWSLSNDFSYGDYGNALSAFSKDYMQRNPYTGANPSSYGMSLPQLEASGGASPDAYKAFQDQDAYDLEMRKAFGATLTPEQAARFKQVTNEYNSKMHKRGNMMGALALGGVAGIGALGGGALSGLGGAGAGATGGAMEGAGSLLGSDLLGGLGSEWLGGLGQFGGLGAGGSGAMGGIGSLISEYGPQLASTLLGGGGSSGGGSSGGGGLASLLGNSGLGLTALSAIMGLRNNQNLPGVPDYMKLAQQTADSQNQQLAQQTLANRPNQVNAQGDQLNWMQGPNGQWTQSVNLSAPNQQRMQQQQQMASALRSQIMNQQSKPTQMPAMDNFAWGG